MIKIIYKDIAVGSKTAFAPSSSDAASISKLSDLNADLVFTSFGTGGELNQFLLDGGQSVLPDDLTNVPLGLWSNQLSGDDGSFATPITLTITASGLYSSQGITLTFDPDVGVFATAVNIKWYNGTTLLYASISRPTALIISARRRSTTTTKSSWPSRRSTSRTAD